MELSKRIEKIKWLTQEPDVFPCTACSSVTKKKPRKATFFYVLIMPDAEARIAVCTHCIGLDPKRMRSILKK